VGPLCENMLYTKPETPNVSQDGATVFEICEQTVRQTDEQTHRLTNTDILIPTLRATSLTK